MSPADCTGTAVPVIDEPLLVGEPHAVRPPTTGWPEAVAKAPSSFAEALAALEAVDAEIAGLGAEDIPDDLSDRHGAALAAFIESPAPDMDDALIKLQRFLSEFGIKRIADGPVLDEGVLREDAALQRIHNDMMRLHLGRLIPHAGPGREILPPDPANAGAVALADLIGDLERTWAAAKAISSEDEERHALAGDAHYDAQMAVADFRPGSFQDLVAKVRVLSSAAGDDCLLDARMVSRPAGAVLDDILRLGDTASTEAEQRCPAARLMVEHEPIYAEFEKDGERPIGQPEGPSGRAKDLLEERATWARATSLRGAMYQLAMAIGRLDLIDAAGNAASVDEQLRRSLDYRAVDRLLASALEAIRATLGGEPLSNMLDAYCGNTARRAAELSDEPPEFDVFTFIKETEAAGGRLSVHEDSEWVARLQITPPREGTAEVLAELANPIKLRAVQEYADERRKAERYFDRVARGLHA